MAEIEVTNKTHELKSWPNEFEAVRDLRKTFEVRVDDREYKVGDWLLLREWVKNPDGCRKYLAFGRSAAETARDCNLDAGHAGDHDTEAGYTGREERVVVTYVYRGDEQGVPVPLRTGGLKPVVVLAFAMGIYGDANTD